MRASIAGAPASARRLWAGRVISGIAVLFLLFDSVIKLMVIAPVVQSFTRSSLVGAVLLTGYLGGAVATHVRADSPLFSHVLFPVYVAAFLWGGLYLRDERVRALMSPRT